LGYFEPRTRRLQEKMERGGFNLQKGKKPRPQVTTITGVTV